MNEDDKPKLTLAYMRRPEIREKVQAILEQCRRDSQTPEGQARIKELLRSYGINVERGEDHDPSEMQVRSEPFSDKETEANMSPQRKRMFPPGSSERFEK
ncbi:MULTISPECIES: hypothetical protein [unclassified Phaeobacter]|uniref:hypothetical protein n=1 Tax=unclassified Phaeobacter TaxID=2621772 RepID=UPI003A8A0FEB